MHQFTAEEFRLLLDDLLLYCGDGNVREITDTYGPTPHGGGYCEASFTPAWIRSSS
jgi:hypothetical protein